MRKTKEQKLEILKEAKRKEDEFKLLRTTRKNLIKSQPHHFWRLLWFYISYPFIWIWKNIKDFRTFVIFVIVMLVVGCEEWIPLVIGLIFKSYTFGKTLLGVAAACEAFWLAPFTPFLPLCIVITIAVKSAFNKLRFRKLENK